MRSTAVGELVCCVLFPFLFFGFLGAPTSLANIVGTLVVVVMLLQGAAFWLIKARLMAGRPVFEGWISAFVVLRTIDRVVLVMCLAAIGWSMATSGVAETWLGAALWILALLEHVNYFHVQLMYDNRADLAWLVRHGPKRSALARDLDRHERAGRRAIAP